MSQSFHLYQLQKIDTQLDQGALRIQEIKARIDSDHRTEDQQSVIVGAEKALHDEQSQLKKLEHEATARRLKLEQSEASLYGGKVRIPKELQDLQNEVASLKRSLAALEDQQLEAMVRVEDAQAALATTQKTLSSIFATVTGENAVLAGESSMLKTLSERLQKEREAVLPQIEPAYRDEYERLRIKKRGIAVAALLDEACSACGTLLTPADRQIARSPNQIYHCPSCGRIIYSG